MSRRERPTQEAESSILSRRKFLTVGVLGACAVLLGGDSSLFSRRVGGGVNETDNALSSPPSDVGRLVAHFESEFHSALGLDGKEIKQAELQLVPEWECTGSDMFITMPSTSPGLSYKLRERWSGILKAIPPGTNVHVMTFTGFSSALLEELKLTFPHINFKSYEYDGEKFDDTMYSQDMVFASGKRDLAGRFKLFTSTLDRAVIGSGKRENSFACMGLEGDDYLARAYPETFVSQSVPTRLEGGDLQATVFPGGKSAIIVGDSNLRLSVQYARLGANENGRNYENYNFNYAYIGNKALFQIFMGVQMVLVTDEKDILTRMVGMPVNDFHEGRNGFYHVDMILRTAVTLGGKVVAFCTNTDKSRTEVSDKDISYLQRIHKQFDEFGYEIEYLPCGPYPALNYTNVLMFTPKGGSPTVMLPCYGLDSDDVAAAVYERRGFKVIPTDMSFMKKLSPDVLRGIGSLHCMVEVLA